MRTLILSDAHLGAWTGEDLLRRPATLERLAPHLEGIDEVVFLGDMLDLLFGQLPHAVGAADGLLELLRDKLQGGRFVFVAGNHDHHLVYQQLEYVRGLSLAAGRRGDALDEEPEHEHWFRRLLEQRLEGVEVELRYPSYMAGDVLCTHGHYLDIHARRRGTAPSRLLAWALWAVAEGDGRRATRPGDYEGPTTLLTELLYVIAQLPNGTRAQHRVDALVMRAGELLGAPADLARRARALVSSGDDDDGEAGSGGYADAQTHEDDRRQRRGPGGRGRANASHLGRVVMPSDPNGPQLDAFAEVVARLGWAPPSGKVVFAHTHQPLADVRPPGSAVRYWNTGSWIYEPDLGSERAYRAYLRNAWPGTAVLIDSEQPDPVLIEALADLNPLNGARGDGTPAIARELGFAGGEH